MTDKHIQDPHAAREADKYDNPIPSREYIISLLENANGPMTFKSIVIALDLWDDEQKIALKRRLRAM